MLIRKRQQAQRLRAWRDELSAHLFEPVASVTFCGFTTYKRISHTELGGHSTRPFPIGTAWGQKWEYAWFNAEVTLPERCKGQRVVFFSGLGGEQLVYLNGRAIGSIDKEHRYVTLTRDAQGGERFNLHIESYAGHGARLENLPPCPPEKKAVPEVTSPQCTVGESFVSVWNEDAYQLLLDVETLARLLDTLPEKSLRGQRVLSALIDFTHIADFELPASERNESFRRARSALKPLLQCRNGSTAPLMWLIGQSHIDLAWLWHEEETYHKSVRTYSNQLTLMDEYPEYRFLLCEPILLEMLKATDADVWRRVVDAYKRGQLVPEGAFYVECDTNIPSGESLIRQLMWGKRWYRQQFGIDSQVAWQPDTFGYSAALPQILKGFGVKYFATQKLLRADPECQRFPYQEFVWEGMDGSTVLGLSFFKNNAPVEPISFVVRWEKDRAQDENIDTLLYPFGYGDGGGGPTRDMLELARRMGDLEGLPRSRYGGLREFFEHISEKRIENRWVGELYLAWHRGTYTAQRRTKALIRKLEIAIKRAEALCALNGSGKSEIVDDAWRTLMLYQFHDVAGGVGIHRVHEEAEQKLSSALESVSAYADELSVKLYGIKENAYKHVILNTLPWERRELVRLSDGRRVYARAVPMGAVDCEPIEQAPDDASATKTADGYTLANKLISLNVDSCGRVTALSDLKNGKPLMDSGMYMNDWRLYKNVQTVYDAWELDRDWARDRLGEPFEVSVELSERGGDMCELTVRRIFGESEAIQKIRLYASSRRVDFVNRIDWRERHRLLKAHFESNLLCDSMINEIQYGFVSRPAHASDARSSDMYECANHRYSAMCETNRGFALLNAGIYGISADRGELALSLLRAPLVPDDECDRGIHEMTYSLYPFTGALAESGVLRAGYELNEPLRIVRGECAELKEQAECVQRYGFTCDARNVIIDAVKPAEDDNSIILRLYEAMRETCDCTLKLPFKASIYDCGMAETETGKPLGEGDSIRLAVKPFQIITLRLVRIGQARC